MESAGCVFCQIVAGSEPAHLVWDDGVSLAMLDRRPLFHGHTLVIPKAHHETLGDLSPDLVDPIFSRARRLSRAMEGLSLDDAPPVAGTFIAMNNRVSQSVPHLHVHVVPRRRKDGLRGFFWPRTAYRDDDHMRLVARELADAYAAEGA